MLSSEPAIGCSDHYKGGRVYYFDGFSLLESMFLSNLISWSKSKNFKPPIYKTDEEMAKEIHCGIRTISRIKRKLKKLGAIIVGKQQNSQFLGATPYFLNKEKIIDLGNSEILKELDRMSTADRQNGERRSPNCLTPFANMSASYIEADTQQLSQQNKPLTPLEGDKRGFDQKRKNDLFEKAWKAYGKIGTKKSAHKAYLKAIKSIAHEELIERIKAYYANYEARKSKKEWQPSHKHFSSWLNQECWDDEMCKPPPKPKTEAEKKAELMEKIRRGEM